MIMPERDGYIPGVPCWVDTNQPEPEAAAAFYGRLFGWEVEDAMPPGSEGRYFMGRINGRDAAAISSSPPGAPERPTWNTYICVDDVDATVTTVRESGGTIVAAPFDVMDAGRMAVVTDTEGAVFSLWQAGRHPGATVVNEHGALNFNGLATRDVERAKAFYGAVFGWEVLDLAAGLMWTLPGYGDHLEESTPGLRAQMEQMGAPAGFIDVVAALQPIGADDAAAVRWDVTFGVDDVDAVAARATELGGEVVRGPLDAPWSRVAEIKDPHGATFIASQFVPENSELGT
jgi:predicted enzyme related to lactoylglutathione lyase